MMKRNISMAGKLAAAVFIGLCILFSVSDADAQGTRRKRVPPVTRPTPTVPQAEPQIISRAEDFPDTDSPQIITSLPVMKSDETARPVDDGAATIEDLKSRVKSLESVKKVDNDEKQKRLLLNLDILSKAEQRTETLRKQLFEMIERESSIKTKLDLIEADIRPDSIERTVAFAGSLRPEELRNMRKKNLEIERASLSALLIEVQRTRANLDQNLQRADLLVEKLRVKLEKEIDDALVDDPDKR
jgi:hypothetical protein